MRLLNLNRKDFASWSDDRMVSELIKGNQDAIVWFFYTKYSATFQYHIFKLFNYKVDINDLVDEFFLYLYDNDWKRLRSFDSSQASLNTWISTVSYRFFRDYKQSMIDSDGVSTTNDMWDSTCSDWTQSCDAGIMMDVNSAIGQIKSERDRQIAIRLFVEDKEYESVAQEFGLTVDYVYTVKNRLIKQLRNSLKEYN